MLLFADVMLQNILTIVGIIVGAIVVFWLVHKIVKFVLSLVIVLVIVAAALFYCVHAGYISAETAEKINPLNNEKVVTAVKDASAWAGNKAKEAAKKAIAQAVNEAAEESSAPAGSQSKK